MSDNKTNPPPLPDFASLSSELQDACIPDRVCSLVQQATRVIEPEKLPEFLSDLVTTIRECNPDALTTFLADTADTGDSSSSDGSSDMDAVVEVADSDSLPSHFFPLEGFLQPLPLTLPTQDLDEYEKTLYQFCGNTGVLIHHLVNLQDFASVGLPPDREQPPSSLAELHKDITREDCLCDQCQKDRCVSPLRRPMYMVMYSNRLMQPPTIMCLTHMRTLICRQCRDECFESQHLDQHVDDYKLKSSRAGHEQRRTMTWFCTRHDSHGCCPECADCGSFCAYVLFAINHFNSVHFEPVHEHYILSEAGQAKEEMEVGQAHFLGVLLHFFSYQQTLSYVLHFLHYRVRSIEELEDYMRGEKPADKNEERRMEINRRLCLGEQELTDAVCSRLLTLVKRLSTREDEVEELRRDVTRLENKLRRKAAQLQNKQAQLGSLQQEKKGLEEGLAEAQDKLTSLQAQDKEIAALQTKLASSRSEGRQLRQQLSTEKEASARLQTELQQLRKSAKEAQREAQQASQKLKAEQEQRQNLVTLKLQLERKLAQASQKLKTEQEQRQKAQKAQQDKVVVTGRREAAVGRGETPSAVSKQSLQEWCNGEDLSFLSDYLVGDR